MKSRQSLTPRSSLQARSIGSFAKAVDVTLVNALMGIQSSAFRPERWVPSDRSWGAKRSFANCGAGAGRLIECSGPGNCAPTSLTNNIEWGKSLQIAAWVYKRLQRGNVTSRARRTGWSKRNSQMDRMMSDAYGRRLSERMRAEHAQAIIWRGLREAYMPSQRFDPIIHHRQLATNSSGKMPFSSVCYSAMLDLGVRTLSAVEPNFFNCCARCRIVLKGAKAPHSAEVELEAEPFQRR